MNEQREQFRAHWVERVAAGACPHSGLTIASCKKSDLCDCFDVWREDAFKSAGELGPLFDEAYPNE